MSSGTLAEVIATLTRQVERPAARCVIACEGLPDESTLMGTRDGYLNLAIALLGFVADFDSGRAEMIDAGEAWDDRIKAAMYSLPSPVRTWIVGCSLYRDHADYIRALSQLVGPQIGDPLSNDPQFAEPCRGELL